MFFGPAVTHTAYFGGKILPVRRVASETSGFVEARPFACTIQTVCCLWEKGRMLSLPPSRDISSSSWRNGTVPLPSIHPSTHRFQQMRAIPACSLTGWQLFISRTRPFPRPCSFSGRPPPSLVPSSPRSCDTPGRVAGVIRGWLDIRDRGRARRDVHGPSGGQRDDRGGGWLPPGPGGQVPGAN